MSTSRKPDLRPPDLEEDGIASPAEMISGSDFQQVIEAYQALPPAVVAQPQEVIGFDFSTKRIHQWEVNAIRRASNTDELEVCPHAVDELRKDHIDLTYDLPQIISRGRATEKDLPGEVRGDGFTRREPGINFEHTLDDGRHARIKVAYEDGYWVVTGHVIRRRR